MRATKVEDNTLLVLKDVVSGHTNDNGMIDWVGVELVMRRAYPNRHSTVETWRTMWRKETNDKVALSLKRGRDKLDDKRAGAYDLTDRVLKAIKSKRTTEFLVERLGEDEDTILGVVLRLQLNGYNINVWDEDNKTWVYNVPVVETGDAKINRLKTTQEIKIGVVSDTHLGSNYEALGELQRFYEYAHSKGVNEFYHVGDISDGYYKNRDESIYEQHKLGFDNQLDYIIKEYPRIDDCITFFITGNHDATHIRNGGANIGKVIGMYRDDLIYIGHNFAKVWLTQEIDMNLVHPNDGSSTAISYKAQKIVDGATGARKSKILLVGHYHKTAWLYYKDTHIVVVPSFQRQTSFMAGHNLASNVGGYILTISVDDDGNIISFTPEYVEL